MVKNLIRDREDRRFVDRFAVIFNFYVKIIYVQVEHNLSLYLLYSFSQIIHRGPSSSKYKIKGGIYRAKQLFLRHEDPVAAKRDIDRDSYRIQLKWGRRDRRRSNRVITVQRNLLCTRVSFVNPGNGERTGLSIA